jgi:hypothetical protein
VELLVVMALIVILAAITVTFVPRVSERQKTARAADLLQGWLGIARQWAQRDGVPTGVRIHPGSLYPNVASPTLDYRHDVQYIQQPDAFFAGQRYYLVITTGATSTTATLTPLPSGANFDFYNGSPAVPAQWVVQPGDYLETGVGTAVYRIAGITTSGTPAYDTLTLSPAPTANPGTQDYRINRSPRILAGESALQLPKDTAIDNVLTTAYGYPLPTNPSTGTVDIIFAPNGSVIGQGAVKDKIILWARDVTVDAPPAPQGEQVLITIYTRTGFIAGHPVDTSVNTTAGGVSPGAGVTMTVANPANITIGSYLVLQQGTTQETVYVTGVSGSTITLANVVNTYSTPNVLSDPLSFSRDGRSSGM